LKPPTKTKRIDVILKISIIFSFTILLFNRILIFGFDNSLAGYKLERIVFLGFIISSILIYKKSNHKKLIFLGLVFILTTNFLRSFYTGLICTKYEKKIAKNLYLRESTTIESSPAYHIIERNNLIEKNLTRWNSNLNYDEEFQNLENIKKIGLIKQNRSMIILKYEIENRIMIDTFKIKNCS